MSDSEIDVAQIATTPIGQLINRLVWAAPAKGNQRWMAGTIKEVGLSSATIKVADWTCHRFWHQLRWRDNYNVSIHESGTVTGLVTASIFTAVLNGETGREPFNGKNHSRAVCRLTAMKEDDIFRKHAQERIEELCRIIVRGCVGRITDWTNDTTRTIRLPWAGGITLKPKDQT